MRFILFIISMLLLAGCCNGIDVTDLLVNQLLMRTSCSPMAAGGSRNQLVVSVLGATDSLGTN
ncbi:MAG: hypothetical protein IJ971_01265 [Bacteroidales bacterium]|nr:hypothetical protein [Bacteroidales bacterium]